MALTDWLIEPIRRILPPVGMLDFSPLVAWLVLTLVRGFVLSLPLIDATPTGIRLRVRVQPRASRTAMAGRYGDALRIRLAAPPVDGAANEALARSWPSGSRCHGCGGVMAGGPLARSSRSPASARSRRPAAWGSEPWPPARRLTWTSDNRFVAICAACGHVKQSLKRVP